LNWSLRCPALLKNSAGPAARLTYIVTEGGWEISTIKFEQLAAPVDLAIGHPEKAVAWSRLGFWLGIAA
jgi:hypothetical protein